MKTRIRDVGEFGLIARIEALSRRAFGSRALPSVALGIGDDAALLRVRAGEQVVVTTDALVEGVHFDFAQESARTAGRRALVANLSDLAATGARPLGFVVALAAPPSLELARALGIARGLLDVAAQLDCPLVGGNLARASEVSVAITAIGAVRAGRGLLRSGARAGDRVFVTGTLGGAALDRARKRVTRAAVPRIGAGIALARTRGVGACIDVSDGLAADLMHVCRASGVRARLEVAAIPTPSGFAKACARVRRDPLALALAGGEDYELLFTARGGAAKTGLLSRRLGVRVTEIGRIEAGRAAVLGLPEGLGAGGFRHY
ncbi:MAG: thiamine-phosphate kinase [Deltaproteobacteria bacterium]|nr:thiamine-phosphate kinase [Deltaproteobacteria bacterium]